MNTNERWWTVVPNSVRFIDDIAAALKGGSSVIYSISENCEWKDTLRDKIKANIFSGVDKTHEISGKLIGDRSPGEYLMETFVKKELRSKYRTSIGYEKFLTDKEDETSLLHSFIYLVDLSDEQTHDWVTFIENYNKLHKSKIEKCRFIIETKTNLKSKYSGIRLFKRSDYLHNYDITILCMMTISSNKIHNIFRNYATELATLCSNNDPEFAAELITSSDMLIKETNSLINKIVSNSIRSNMESFTFTDDLDRKIWEAQLKVFFPLIERFRLYLIEKYKYNIHLDSSVTNLKGEEIRSEYDIELATLKWLCNNNDLYMNSGDYNDLKFFKECRNNLAHLKYLPYESLKRIVETTDRI